MKCQNLWMNRLFICNICHFAALLPCASHFSHIMALYIFMVFMLLFDKSNYANMITLCMLIVFVNQLAGCKRNEELR